MAKRFRIGNAQLPIYAASGYALSGILLVSGCLRPYGTEWRIPLMFAAVIALLAGATAHILDKLERCVGRVWDAGGRAERRRAEAEAQARREQFAVVRTMVQGS